ncbi:hypothetical protein BGZ70_010061 [Mortierella alpina]|uniref:PAS fold-3 domain-containing protein n=1 Tax=Mortierella alpina TaxID=64518 RepID=A0A9P6J210_MORAP|nr:hypothetical protein BGZ70_010061 [Mortierella alpina]
MASTSCSELNCITFHDLSPRALYLWASPSIEDCLGYSAEELIDTSPYDLLILDDLPSATTAHTENVLNDMVASQALVRYRHKNGSAVPVLAIFSVCYEFLVVCLTVLDSDFTTFKARQVHSAAMTRIVQSKQEEFARIRRHHTAFKAVPRNGWNTQELEPEFRVCMILNRYSRALGVLYASPSCEQVLLIDSEAIVGKPFLLFIRADDLGSFVDQVQVAKSSTAITHMRFWFQSPNWVQEIPCEATLFSAADGLIVIMRRCRPFVRRRLIGGVDLYERKSATPMSQPSSVESDSAQYIRSISSTPSSGSNDQRGRGKVISASIKRLIELDEDEDLKPLVAVAEGEHSPKDESAGVQLENQPHFRPHVRIDEDDDMMEEELQ